MSAAAGTRILMDATELIRNPVRTGVQRVVRCLLQHWPDADELVLCRYDPQHGIVPVPARVKQLLHDPLDASAATPHAELAREIAGLLAGAAPARPDLPILVPEVFFDPARCAHHRLLLEADPTRRSFIAYDFIPYLHPDVLGVQETAGLMHYVQLLRDAPRVGFISSQTRDDYVHRIRRRPEVPAGPVFPMGADGPGISRQAWRSGRDTFLAVGSIDGRKNQDLILDAFERMWAAGIPARLAMVGRVFESPHVEALRARLARLAATQPLFTHLWDVSDEALAGLYGQARATIYASEIEGYGLPPVESLHCGVPVIASARVPSMMDVAAGGHVALEEVSAGTISGAVRQLMDDAAAARLWAEAARAHTSTWADMASAVAAWVRGA